MRRVTLLWSLLLVHSPQASAAEGLDYSYLEFAYAIDATVEAYGQAFDSDSSFRISAAYLLKNHLLLSAQAYFGGYDFANHDDYDLSGYRV